MVIDFSKVDIHEQPVLILKNTSGVPLGTLGAASNVIADIKYNEVSTLDFNLPAYTDGVEVPNYNSVVGMRIIDLQDMGQFILMNPKETGDGIKKSKTCKAYSLEYEFTFKKITLQNGTYNFWNPVAPNDTILGIILELMPSWSVGAVDSSLIGKYRTYEVSEENLYNFIKNTLQQSYSCIFDFDTYNRVINVKDVSSTVPTNPLYISLDNLAKEITIEEDTENIITRLDVNGADGVDIRDVNPTGNNKIINLDYYMTTDNFDQATIDKYYNWKSLYESYQLPYYNLSIEYSLQIMRKTTETAALTDLEGEMTSLENQQAVIIRAIAENLDSASSLTEINTQIAAKQTEINAKKSEIAMIQDEANSIMLELVAINNITNFQNAFTEEEYLAVDRFIKDDAISESSFVVKSTSSYSNDDYGNKLSSIKLSVDDANITSLTTASNKNIYEIKGGKLKVSSRVTSNIIRCVLEKSTDGTFIMTAYLGKGTIDGDSFETACLSLSGSCGAVTSTASSLNVKSVNAYLYLTLNTSEYAKRSVAWELFEYGNDILTKMSQPSFKFSVSSANFLFIEEFEEFKNSLKQGEKLYVGLSEDQTLAPIAIGLKIEYDSIQNLSLEFSDTYISGDSSFLLADLLEQSVSMGKNVDTSKFTYSAFVDSGANTQVKEFMTSALDVAKNAIMSSKDQAISWGDSGIRLRKWKDESHTSYDPKQIWMNNNSILMTSNNWSTAEIAIGNFYDKNLGNLWGVVAPNIVGTLLAGSNLVIESERKDGSVSVFRVDADGCFLHNSEFSITSDATKTHILLDAEHGIAVGKYPLINSGGNIDTDNYRFWVDETGNLFFKGTLKATNGEFTGKVTATSGYIGGSDGWTIESTYIYNGKPSYTSGNSGIYIGVNGISLGDDKYFIKAHKNGKLTCNHITATGGTIGGCAISNGVLQVANANIISLAVSKISGGKNSADITFNGNITVPNATITGNITATSGTIGGCSISSGSLKITNGHIVSMSADKLTAGTIDASKITVTNLSASSITVGKLKASQINGLPASQITSGKFYANRVGGIGTGADIGSSGNVIITENETGGVVSFTHTTTTKGSHLEIAQGWVSMSSGTDSSAKATVYASGRGSLSGTWTDNSGVGITSDMNKKNSIQDISNSYDLFFNYIKPRTFRYNDGTSNRTHTGFIAQEIEDAIIKSGLTTQDLALIMQIEDINKNDLSTKTSYYLRYNEFVAINTWQIQKLKSRICELEAKVASLEQSGGV